LASWHPFCRTSTTTTGDVSVVDDQLGAGKEIADPIQPYSIKRGDLMKKIQMLLSVAVLVVLCCGSAQAQNNPLITVDENGNGALLFPGAPPIPTIGVLAPDPGPGGLAAALTYNLLGPPGLVAGDVFLLEPGTSNSVSDIIRFNPAGTGNPGYPASLVFYSDTADAGLEMPTLADTGFPTAFYTNQLVLREVGTTNHSATYTPTASQPGFIPGFAVTYQITSSAPPIVPVPEPTTLALFGVGTLGLAGWRLRRRPTTDA
jgi:hypothetical protein